MSASPDRDPAPNERKPRAPASGAAKPKRPKAAAAPRTSAARDGDKKADATAKSAAKSAAQKLELTSAPGAGQETPSKAKAASARGGRATAKNRAASAEQEPVAPAVGGPLESAAKGKPERPDEFSPETFEFIAAVDEFKRRRMRTQLSTADVLVVLCSLGYRGPLADEGAELVRVEAALAQYKRTHKRLFPGWSEIFSVVVGTGYRRAA